MPKQQALLPGLHLTQRYNWEQIEEVCKFLAPQASAYFEGIMDTHGLESHELSLIPVARGGFIPALLLSNLLGVKIEYVVHVWSYQRVRSKRMTTVVGDAGLPELSERIVKGAIFVDDIIDTGETARFLKERYPDAVFVAPFGKLTGVHVVKEELDALLCTIPVVVDDNIWIEFPWEYNIAAYSPTV